MDPESEHMNPESDPWMHKSREPEQVFFCVIKSVRHWYLIVDVVCNPLPQPDLVVKAIVDVQTNDGLRCKTGYACQVILRLVCREAPAPSQFTVTPRNSEHSLLNVPNCGAVLQCIFRVCASL